jgi:hypothetical protein
MTMRRSKHILANKRRGHLDTVTVVASDHVIPVSDVTPAKLIADPKLTVELKQEVKSAQKASKHGRSTS